MPLGGELRVLHLFEALCFKQACFSERAPLSSARVLRGLGCAFARVACDKNE
jgi:hypothetical protein